MTIRREAALGELELVVLLAVLRAGPDAYGVTIQREIDTRTGRDVARGAVYITLDRLDKKGLLESSFGSPTAVRGGRAKRFYRPTRAGLAALRAALNDLRSLEAGLEPLLRRPR